MSNLLSRMARSFLGRRAPSQPDIEHGHPASASFPKPMPHIDHDGLPQLSPDDQLNLFRHLTGITSHPSMTHSYLHRGGRAAPNIGIYARVVRNEQDSKKGYKHYSWLINSCLGLQLIVAAALTAMGAAGASHSAVTAFGAINTVMAGLLTFLKGSGLPNRLEYYQSEWKRVREFIEQRERDFSRPGCDLDVYGVVARVEKMYEEVKVDSEASAPDRFAGLRGGQRSHQGTDGDAKLASLSLPRKVPEVISEKLKGLEEGLGGKVMNIVSDLTHKTQAVQASNGAARDVQDVKTAVGDAAKELNGRSQIVQHLSDGLAKSLNVQVERVQPLEEHARTIENVTKGLNERVDQAQQLEKSIRTTAESQPSIDVGSAVDPSFLAKLKDLRAEIGSRTHLAQEAMHYIQAAHQHHEKDDAEAKDGDHQTEHDAGS